MGTRTVNFRAKQATASAGDVAYGGAYRIEPYPKVDRAKGAYQLMPDSIVLPLTNGGATCVLEDTVSYSGAYLITSPSRQHRYIQVPPGAGAIDYTACTDVDPTTLDPALLPEAAWYSVVTGIRDQLDLFNPALADSSATPDTIAKRTGSGTLAVAPATADGEAVTLGQAALAAANAAQAAVEGALATVVSLVPDPDNPGLYLIASGLTADPDNDGLYLIGALA